MSSEMLPSPLGLASEPPLINSRGSPENPGFSGTKINPVRNSNGINRLRPYQREVALAILDSVFGRKGFTFSVEIAR